MGKINYLLSEFSWCKNMEITEHVKETSVKDGTNHQHPREVEYVNGKKRVGSVLF